MDAVVDSSMLISLAWSGMLNLIDSCPLTLLVPDAVFDEVVTSGLAHGYPDAAAISSAIATLQRIPGTVVNTVDAAVLEAARDAGLLVTNDATLGRRANNLGVRWLRTADVVVLIVKSGAITSVAGEDAVDALYRAGRITDDLRDAYQQELQ